MGGPPLPVPPRQGVLLYGPPGTGKTLSARAVANRTDACFIRVIGSELVQARPRMGGRAVGCVPLSRRFSPPARLQKYTGEGARMVRELFQLARTKKACIIFFDEVDAIGGTRFDGSGGGGDDEVQRTMLEIVNQLDGFEARGNVKVSKRPLCTRSTPAPRHRRSHARAQVLMATNRPDTLDPALLRPGRVDRRIEFPNPDRRQKRLIFQVRHSMVGGRGEAMGSPERPIISPPSARRPARPR